MRKRRKNQVVVRLKERDFERIEEMLSKGKASAREIRRGLILRMMHQGKTGPKAADAVGVMAKTARDIAHRYNEGGLELSLYDKPRPGQKRKLTSRERQQIIAMVCSAPPLGYSRWSIRLITEEVFKRKMVKERIGREMIRIILQEHDMKPWRKKNVVRRGVNGRVH